MEDPIQFSLAFKDQFVENEFRASQSRFHRKCFFILTVVLTFQSAGIFFLNPLDINIFGKEMLIIFLGGISFVNCFYFFIRKKFPAFIDKGITLLVFSYAIAAVEFTHQIQKSTIIDNWVYYLLGINLQTGCLFLMMSRIRWTHSIFVIMTTHIFAWFRITDIISTPGAQKVASISLTAHIFIILTLTYSSEKEVRKAFQKIRAHSQQLLRFEEIVKSVIQSAIIILREDDVTFYNDMCKTIIEIEYKNEVLEKLSGISVFETNGAYEDNFNIPLNNNKKDFQKSTLYEYYRNIERRSQYSNEKKIAGFNNLEGEMQSKTAETKSFSIQIGTIYWKGVKSTIIVIHDVSPLKNHFQHIDSYKDNLLATVSHDLRTPLNGILGILELLYDEIEDPCKKEKLLITIASSKLLLNMINDILDFSLISKGRLRLKFDSTNISSLIEETTQILFLQARMKGIKIEVQSNISSNENFLVDNNRLRQVLLNLIGNAVKFTKNGQVTVRIYEEFIHPIYPSGTFSLSNHSRMFKSDSIDSVKEDSIKIPSKKEVVIRKMPSLPNNNNNNNSLYLSSMGLDRKLLNFEVEDTGIGIKPEDIGKLFKLFSRVTSGHEKNMNGIGLGLAISQSLVKLMNCNRRNAEITVVSEFGKGSKFIFPLYIDNDPSATFREMEEKSMNLPLFLETKPQIINRLDKPYHFALLESENDLLIEQIKKEKKLILVVDDDSLNILVASTYLKTLENEYSFVTADNGKDAIDKVKSFADNKQYFDVFLMDCNMPIMNGYEASQELKLMMLTNFIPWAPIVAITANITNADKERCHKSGMDLFLTKPYMKPQLIKILDDALKLNINL